MADLRGSACTCAAVATALALVASVAVVASGSRGRVRNGLDLRFAEPVRDASQAIDIAVQNGRLAAAGLLAAAVVSRIPATRPVLDLVLGAVLALNASLFGLALGAYGLRLLAAVALHLPFELCAFSLAGGSYLQARRAARPGASLPALAGVCVLLLAVAALAESYLTLTGAP